VTFDGKMGPEWVVLRSERLGPVALTLNRTIMQQVNVL